MLCSLYIMKAQQYTLRSSSWFYDTVFKDWNRIRSCCNYVFAVAILHDVGIIYYYIIMTAVRGTDNVAVWYCNINITSTGVCNIYFEFVFKKNLFSRLFRTKKQNNKHFTFTTHSDSCWGHRSISYDTDACVYRYNITNCCDIILLYFYVCFLFYHPLEDRDRVQPTCDILYR